MRRVTGLTVTEELGFFIDREDMESAVVVGPLVGDVVLNEPFGDDLHSVCVPHEAVQGFELRGSNGSGVLVLWFRRGDRSLEHEIGIVTPDVPSEEWLERVNSLYRPHRLPVAAHPATQSAPPVTQ